MSLLGQVAFNQKKFKESAELYKQSCQAGFAPACTQEIALRKNLEGGTEGAPETAGNPAATLAQPLTPQPLAPPPTGKSEPPSLGPPGPRPR